MILSVPIGCSLLLLSRAASGQALFYADFDSDASAKPDASVNDPAKWKPDIGKMDLTVSHFPATGTDALENRSDGCDQSGTARFPGDVEFSDGIIQFTAGWKDNDAVGVVLRQQDSETGYLVAFQASEVPSAMIALWDICSDGMPACLAQAGGGCESPEDVLAMKPHMLTVDETGGKAVFCRVEAVGDTIRAWQLQLADVPNRMARDLGVPPTVEVQDSTHAAGYVSLFHESNPSWFDDILVSGPDFLAVHPLGKSAVTWGVLKRDR